MEPVEINAGGYYLRALRADDRMDDRPRIVEGFADADFKRWHPMVEMPDLDSAGNYVAKRAEEWAGETRASWAIAEPTTGLLLGEVGLKSLDLDAHTGEASVWLHPEARGRGVATETLGAVLRFGFGALDLQVISYRHSAGNTASAALAQRLGFIHDPSYREDRGYGPEYLEVRWSLSG